MEPEEEPKPLTTCLPQRTQGIRVAPQRAVVMPP
jgi:hypothetical protein